jgi:hypothetical protein
MDKVEEFQISSKIQVQFKVPPKLQDTASRARWVKETPHSSQAKNHNRQPNNTQAKPREPSQLEQF